MNKNIYRFAILFAMLFGLQASAIQQSESLPKLQKKKTEKTDSSLAQIAILLDTSGSMEGLVDQARMQLWNVVNEIGMTSRNGKKTEVEVAIFQYGSDNVSSTTGYIKKVLEFSNDLDDVSRALFALTLRGGKEYCGEAVRQACDDLEWDKRSGFRAIFIAGNEAFDQGSTTLASVLPRLSAKDIRVNTIYCRWKKAKQNEAALWKYGAQLGNGKFSEINHNKLMTKLNTPFDPEFRNLNRRMNETFVWFGPNGTKHMKNQIQQDANAKRMSNQVFADRMATKIGHLYKHVHSDLVDAVQHGIAKLSKMPSEKMPESIRAMTASERESFIRKKISDRESIRREMTTLISKRNAWLQAKMSRQVADNQTGTWGDALVTLVKSQLAESGFTTK